LARRRFWARILCTAFADALVHGVAEIAAVGEHVVDRALGPRLAAPETVGALAPLCNLVRDVQLAGNGERGVGVGERVKFIHPDKEMLTRQRLP
jgi:hypothetical protein